MSEKMLLKFSNAAVEIDDSTDLSSFSKERLDKINFALAAHRQSAKEVGVEFPFEGVQSKVIKLLHPMYKSIAVE